MQRVLSHIYIQKVSNRMIYKSGSIAVSQLQWIRNNTSIHSNLNLYMHTARAGRTQVDNLRPHPVCAMRVDLWKFTHTPKALFISKMEIVCEWNDGLFVYEDLHMITQ